ncbi:MAG: 50S ribosomal protein L4 [Nanoarchaeota archaeon]|nr:50S ribosomal protein L4 [Nanoarchaeota archaeon]
MKKDIYNLDGKKSGSLELPKQFSEAIRPDLIKKVNNAIESNKRQKYGAYLGAGIRAAAELSRRRKRFKGSYGHGISRVPRKHSWRRGVQFGFVGAFAPGTVSGRRAHPPRSEKNLKKKINITENRLAIRSAISSTIMENLVKERGHHFTELISIIDNGVESITKTKEIQNLLIKLDLKKELERISQKKVRSGRGKMRNRKYKTRKGPLFVVSGKCPIMESGINIQGIDVCEVKNLNVNILAPGGNPGRLTIFTEKAIKEMTDNNLFFKNTVKKAEVKETTKAVKKATVKKTSKAVKK